MLFILESVIKLIGIGFYEFFSSGLNIFDFSIALLSLVDFLIS